MRPAPDNRTVDFFAGIHYPALRRADNEHGGLDAERALYGIRNAFRVTRDWLPFTRTLRAR
jgi:hypothetical protein